MLQPDGILALKLTHPALNTIFPALMPDVVLDQCARFAIERHCSLPNKEYRSKRCILCKIRYPKDMFVSSSSPLCLSDGIFASEVVELPPSFCAWHVGRLVRVVRTALGGRNEWISGVKVMCMHGGCIEGWQDCTCRCSSCGYAVVRTYTRFLNNDTECKKFHFRRRLDPEGKDNQESNMGGQLFVQEKCWDTSKDF